MKLGYVLTLLALCCFGATTFSGCETDTKVASTSDHDHDGHDHGDHDGHDHDGHDHDGHDHDGHDHAEGELPAHGPNGGHLFKLDGSDMVGEWIHYSDNDIIRVLLLDSELQNAVAFDGVSITPKAGDDKTPFVLELDPEKNVNDQKLVYMLDDPRLMKNMSLGVVVEYTVGDEKFSGEIKPHAPHDH
ncbi:hypothetical protein [Mariniblastus fucicola]|uniref:Uncharacterized protein n=1 Tax=Mariniblastus fucicola TaxID=980251 RepID=A0A5B9P7R6_9BACT|nr:hypothetical protein [Mariniblastus fucicola]QEG22384.1 hypothetical protein MFFC18_22640 [Mariniblastus fucicola]